MSTSPDYSQKTDDELIQEYQELVASISSLEHDERRLTWNGKLYPLFNELSRRLPPDAEPHGLGRSGADPGRGSASGDLIRVRTVSRPIGGSHSSLLNVGAHTSRPSAQLDDGSPRHQRFPSMLPS
jgi:hypothetical protein